MYRQGLISASTLERVERHWGPFENMLILEDVIETVAQCPHMLDIFCDLVQHVLRDTELAQQIQGILFGPRMQCTDMRLCTVFGSVGVMCLEIIMCIISMFLTCVKKSCFTKVCILATV